MVELTRGQVRKLARMMNLVLQPERFGCHLDTGDPDTYQDRIGNIIDEAIGVMEDIQDPLPTSQRGDFEGAPWIGSERFCWAPYRPTNTAGRVLRLSWSNSTPESN